MQLCLTHSDALTLLANLTQAVSRVEEIAEENRDQTGPDDVLLSKLRKALS